MGKVFEVTTDSLLGEADEKSLEVKIQNRPLAERVRLINTLEERISKRSSKSSTRC